MKKKIYLASPLFNEQERNFNLEIRNTLSQNFTVYLPQIDGLVLNDLIKNNQDIVKSKSIIYESDISAMIDADIIIANLNGAVIDEGVAFEIGYCTALNKTCVGFHSDTRVHFETGHNLMISNSCVQIFNDLNDMYKWITENHK